MTMSVCFPKSKPFISPPPWLLLRRRHSFWAAASLGLTSTLSSLLQHPPPNSIFRSPLSATSFLRSASRMAAAAVPSIVVYVTVPNKEAGKKLAESIITEKLAACVNRVPGVESVYWWEGKVQTDSEELLIIKTRESL